MSYDNIAEPYDSPTHRFLTGFLRVLTAAAGMVILVGGILLMVRQGDLPTHFKTFAGEPASLREVSQVLSGAFRGEALDIVQLGILLLIATPILRVLFVGVGYLIERDWLYVAIAMMVLTVLGSSLIGHR